MKNPQPIRTIYLAFALLLFCSCQKEVSTEVSNTNTSPQVDVYVAGYVADLTAGIPAYWKNGDLVLIDSAHYDTPSYLSFGAGAHSITVSENNVYLAGYEYHQSFRGEHYEGICWKNGMQVALTGGSTASYTGSIAVSGTDVYVAGYEYDNNSFSSVAKYWKNGNPVNLTDGSKIASATSIAVAGNDVYVAGAENHEAKYWKNGQAITLTDGDFAYSITIVGSDIYVAGYGHNGSAHVAKYWKNGNPVNLSNVTNYAEANSIAVSGTDVYVAGYECSGLVNGTYTVTVAKYWKNGNPVNLTTDGSKFAEATSIAISGNDVYVSGYEEITAGSYECVATYWKNGVPVILGDVSKYYESKANAIFLVKK